MPIHRVMSMLTKVGAFLKHQTVDVLWGAICVEMMRACNIALTRGLVCIEIRLGIWVAPFKPGSTESATAGTKLSVPIFSDSLLPPSTDVQPIRVTMSKK
jgi:hypothetical protein